MKALLVAPEFPVTYWGFQYSMRYAGKVASLPPLGLATVAALLPPEWTLRLVDTNLRPLEDADLAWADVLLVGGMRIQAPSIHSILARARAAGVRTVVGGPAPTASPSEYADADAVFCGEAEGRNSELLAAIAGTEPTMRLFAASETRPEMSEVPLPRYDLVEVNQYTSVSIQYSRGCPYQCEFCDVIEIFGRRPRVKSNTQILAELRALYDAGYRGTIFFVDDNFIGNRAAVKTLLPEIEQFQRERGFPYELYTEASINLASDDALTAAMVRSGFNAIFAGIESPSAASLAGANKLHNLQLDLAAAVDKLTVAGIEVMAGFIVGFDEDTEEVFHAQREFIMGTSIALAMIGLLIALPGTALERRLLREGRMRKQTDGDPFGRPNFEPTMDEQTLLQGYAELMADVYSPANYYARLRQFVDTAPPVTVRRPLTWENVKRFARAVVGIGVVSSRRGEFWRLLWHAATRAPHNFSWAVGKTIMGEHVIRYTQEVVVPRIYSAVAEVRSELHTHSVNFDGQIAAPVASCSPPSSPAIGSPTNIASIASGQ